MESFRESGVRRARWTTLPGAPAGRRLAFAAALLGASAWTYSGETDAFGRIEGTVKPPEKVKRILALDRTLRQEQVATQVRLREIEATFDAKTGKYAIAKIDPGVWDLYVETVDGWKIEGVDFRPRDEAEGPLAAEDRKVVREHALKMKTYEDEKRCLRIVGNAENAVLLMELVRHGPTSLSDREPFVTWRVELWFYEKKYGAWTRKEPSKVLRRFRPFVADYSKWTYLFEPSLGGVKVEKGKTATRDFEIPAKPEPQMGRYPGVKDPPPEDDKVLPSEKRVHVEEIKPEDEKKDK